jgi:hypothetical protein
VSTELVLHRVKDAAKGSAERVQSAIEFLGVNYKYRKVHDCADLRHIITQC